METPEPAGGEREEQFPAVVEIEGINPCVDVPEAAVGRLGGPNAAVLVKVIRADRPDAAADDVQGKGMVEQDAGRLQGIGRLTADGWFRTTLVPRQGVPARLFLDTWMRAAAGAAVGDSVRVRLKLDREARELPMPEGLQAILEVEPAAAAAWEALTPSRRREILTYLIFLKTPAALERNIRQTVANLLKRPPKS